MEPTHCDKGPMLEMLGVSIKETHSKLDRIADILTQVAVQEVRVTSLEKKLEASGVRLRKLEDQPRRFFMWLFGSIAGIFFFLIAAWMKNRMGL